MSIKYRNCFIHNVLNYINKTIRLAGWVSSIRNHGSLIFFHLRDSTGTIQVVSDKPLDFGIEYCVSVTGKIIEREQNQINNNMKTGHIEMVLESIDILSKSEIPPFEIDDLNANEEIQLEYRFLSLRNEINKNKILTRTKVINKMREIMNNFGFHEIQTPLLSASSPEGARDFLVPSRNFPGRFYALPQAPQMFKQLLMVSGFGRYFQIAPCFRDEDARAERCPGEFYQLDFEMDFVEVEDVQKVIEHVAICIFKEYGNVNLTEMTYEYAMENYGTDKPDLRLGIKIQDYTEYFKQTDFQIFKDQIKKGALVKGFTVNSYEKKEELLKEAERLGFKFAFASKKNEKTVGPIAKFISDDLLKDNEDLFLVCDTRLNALKNTNWIMNKVGKPKSGFELVFVKDFPMFEWNENKWSFMHNPFSMPQTEDFSDPEKVYAYQYDLVCNGAEILSGGIRNHKLDLLVKCFELCGYDKNTVFDKFRCMTKAFKFGPPPHGGAAFGIERIIMLITNSFNVREVVAFPMNTKGYDPLTGAPTKVEELALKTVHIKTI